MHANKPVRKRHDLRFCRRSRYQSRRGYDLLSGVSNHASLDTDEQMICDLTRTFRGGHRGFSVVFKLSAIEPGQGSYSNAQEQRITEI